VFELFVLFELFLNFEDVRFLKGRDDKGFDKLEHHGVKVIALL
jgi:hypothetical protein